MKKSLFPETYIYGKILELYYNNPGAQYTLHGLSRELNSNENSLRHTAKWLIKDELLIDESHDYIDGNKNMKVHEESYRLSHKGYTFINDLKNTKSSQFRSKIALIISIVAIGITIINSIGYISEKYIKASDEKFIIHSGKATLSLDSARVELDNSIDKKNN